MATELRIKPHEWHYDEATYEWYTILGYEYPDKRCGAVYIGYRIINLGDGLFQLLFCDDHLGEIFDDIKKAKIAAFRHWETIIWDAINGN